MFAPTRRRATVLVVAALFTLLFAAPNLVHAGGDECSDCQVYRIELGGDDPVVGVVAWWDLAPRPCVIWGDAFHSIEIRSNFGDVMELGMVNSEFDGSGAPQIYTRCTACDLGNSGYKYYRPYYDVNQNADPILVQIWYRKSSSVDAGKWEWYVDGTRIREESGAGLPSGGRDVYVGGHTDNDDVDLGVHWHNSVYVAKKSSWASTPTFSLFNPSRLYSGYWRTHYGGRYISAFLTGARVSVFCDTQLGAEPPAGCYE